jgi:hypothetical protein
VCRIQSNKNCESVPLFVGAEPNVGPMAAVELVHVLQRFDKKVTGAKTTNRTRAGSRNRR